MLKIASIILLAQQCAANVEPATMASIVKVESGGNPYAIGVVGGHLKRQPRNAQEAIATAKSLKDNGWNFSMGIAQINRYNLPKYGLNFETVFKPCENLRVGALILNECLGRAKQHSTHSKNPLQAALSCYYSGNFTTGQRGSPSYVQKVLAHMPKNKQKKPIAVGHSTLAIPVISTKRRRSKRNKNLHIIYKDKEPVLQQKSNDEKAIKNTALVF